MFDEDNAGDTAISYTYDFLMGAVSMLDHTFGDGYAKNNPALVGACVQASATNLVAFMHAASAMPPPSDLEMAGLVEAMGALAAGPAPKPRKKTVKKKTQKTRKKKQASP